MSEVLSHVSVQLSADTQQYITAIKKSQKETNKRLKKMQKQMSATSKATQATSRMMVAALGAIGAAMTIGAMKSFVTETVHMNQEQQQLAAQIGISTKKLYAYEYAGKHVGMTAEGMADAFKEVAERMSDAQRGTGEAVALLEELNLSVSDFSNLDPAGQYKALSDELDKLTDKDSLYWADKFGDQFYMLYQRSRQLGISVADLTKEYESLFGMDTSTIDSAMDDMNKALIKIDTTWDVFRQSFLTAVTPPMLDALEEIEGYIKSLGGEGNTNLSKGIVQLIDNSITQFERFIQAILDGYTAVYNTFVGIYNLLQKAGDSMGMTDQFGSTEDADKHRQAIAALIAENNKLEETKNKAGMWGISPQQQAETAAIEELIVANNRKIKSIHEVSVAQKKAFEKSQVMQDMEAPVFKTGFEIDYNKPTAPDKGSDSDSPNIAGAVKTTKALSDARLISIRESLMTEEQLFKETLDAENKATNDAQKKGLLDQEEADRAKLESEMRYNRQVQEIGFGINDFAADAKATEYERLERAQAQELDDLKEHLNSKKELEVDYNAAVYEMELSHSEAKSKLAEAQAKSNAAVLGDQYSQVGAQLSEAFGASKEFALAMTLLDQSRAVASTWADESLGTYEKIAMSAVAGLTVAAEYASIQSVEGQFHAGGVVPEDMNDSSFRLKAGERVLTPDQNQKFEMLESTSALGGSTTIDAPLTINGSVTDEKWFAQQLVKHRSTIAAANQKVQSERPRR
jgi:hypothetical protein